jgi:dipeptidyl aminopeptidase/acylaminoacyl peptidase
MLMSMFDCARRFSPSSICILLLAAVAIRSAAAENTAAKFPSNEDLRHTRNLSHPRLSPDAARVLVEVNDATADGGKTHLWLVDVQKNAARQITFTPSGAKSGESNGEWMPDGESVLFTAHRGEHTQLYRLPMGGGEAQPFDLKIAPPVDVSAAPDAIPPKDDKHPAAAKPAEPVEIDVSHYAVSSDGQTIAIIARDPEAPGEKKQKDEKADAVWVNHEQHRERVYLFHPPAADASGKTQPVQLTPVPVDGDAQQVIWSRKGDQLMVIAEAPNSASDLGPASSAWLVVAAEPAHPRQIKEIPTSIEGGAWSDDGSQFYFSAQAQADTPPGYSDLYALTVSDHSVRNLTAGFRGSLSHGTLPVDADSVLVPVERGTRAGYIRIAQSATTASEAELIPLSGTVVTELNSNRSRSGWVYLRTSSTEPVTLCYSAKLGEPAKTLSAPALMPAVWPAVATKVVTWTSDGHTIEGLLSLPTNADAAHRVPLIVDVHGGPLGAWVDSYSPFAEFLVGRGWAVLRPNPRGSTGRGAAFAAANKNDLGGGDYRDIMAGVDAVVTQYPIDANRIALIGYSYGGEMAGFVEGKTDRFKAIVSGAPVIDQFSEYGTESSSFYDRWYFGKPWEHMDDAWRQSPVSGASHAKTPFLLLQGESDTTDPLGQSLEMYRALRQMNVPVEMVQYPREDHGPLARGFTGGPTSEPWHGFDARQRMVAFIENAFAAHKEAK